MSAKVEVFQRSDGLWDWHLKAENGEILCGSVQGYTSEHDAKRGLSAASELFFDVDYEIRTIPHANSTT